MITLKTEIYTFDEKYSMKKDKKLQSFFSSASHLEVKKGLRVWIPNLSRNWGRSESFIFVEVERVDFNFVKYSEGTLPIQVFQKLMLEVVDFKGFTEHLKKIGQPSKFEWSADLTHNTYRDRLTMRVIAANEAEAKEEMLRQAYIRYKQSSWTVGFLFKSSRVCSLTGKVLE